MIVGWLAVLVGAARGELPLPSYVKELGVARWYEVEKIFETACARDPRWGTYLSCDEDRLRAAIAHADAFQDTVARTAGLEYQVGLAWSLLGERQRAIDRYRAAVALDPDTVEAWYDLGELLLAEGRFPGAREAFTQVARLQAEDLGAYTGEWRLAEVAAHQGDAEGFESHMREALRRGFSFRSHGVGGLPNWRRFYADPKLRGSVEKLLSVYGDAGLLDELGAPPRE